MMCELLNIDLLDFRAGINKVYKSVARLSLLLDTLVEYSYFPSTQVRIPIGFPFITLTSYLTGSLRIYFVPADKCQS